MSTPQKSKRERDLKRSKQRNLQNRNPQCVTGKAVFSSKISADTYVDRIRDCSVRARA